MIHYADLDERTRQFMLRELDMDLDAVTLYVSPRLTQKGRRHYPQLLRQALAAYDDEWLARELQTHRYMKSHEVRRKPTGGATRARVPYCAADTLAEGEFNRFYIRGLCARALEDGMSQVQVYRGKMVKTPRADSEVLIGTRWEAGKLLADLRYHPGVEPCLGLPPGPNSGLTVRLVGIEYVSPGVSA